MGLEEGQFGEFVGFGLGFEEDEFEGFLRGLEREEVEEEGGAMVMKEERR